MSVKAQVVITTIDPPGKSVTLWLAEEVAKPKASIKYEVTDRPKNKGLVEWMGVDPSRMTLSLVFDKFRQQQSVEAEMEMLRSISRMSVQGERGAICRISGPVPLTGVPWHIEDLDWGSYDLRESDGLTVRAYVTVSLLEAVSPNLLVVTKPTPAQQQAANPPAPASGGSVSAQQSARTYTVRSGDTLSSIAQRELGRSTRWTEIASLNGLRDPNRISSGQVLRLP